MTPFITSDPDTGRLTLAHCDRAASYQVQGEVLADLVERINSLVAAGRVAEPVQREAATVTVNRASREARELAARLDRAGGSGDVGKDVVNLRLVLEPAVADELLVWLGDRRGA